MSDHEIFELESVSLQSGLTLRPAQISYKTYGRAERRARQRHRDADVLWRTARRERSD